MIQVGDLIIKVNLLTDFILIDDACALSSGLIDPNTTACVACKPGYKLFEKACVSSCPTDTFLSTSANSCFSNCQFF